MAYKVEESCGDGGRGCVGACDDPGEGIVSGFRVTAQFSGCFLQEVGLAPKLRGGEALAGFRVARLQEVVEKVATVSLLAEGGALSQLLAAVGHVLCATGRDLVEEDLVEAELIDDGHGTALRKQVRRADLTSKALKGLFKLTSRCL